MSAADNTGVGQLTVCRLLTELRPDVRVYEPAENLEPEIQVDRNLFSALHGSM